MNTPVQLSLGLSLQEEATFDTFYPAQMNVQVVQALKQFSDRRGEPTIALWGGRGVGISHLLQACCHAAVRQNVVVQYLPLHVLAGYGAEDVCEGLEGLDLICIDGIETICGQRNWELALFHLFNRTKDAGGRLLLGAHSNFASLPLVLPDLKSRILSCEIYHVAELNDQEKSDALIHRAALRGMALSQEVAGFLLNRSPRDTHALFALLDRLDEETLQRQRRITIPFVKEVFGY